MNLAKQTWQDDDPHRLYAVTSIDRSTGECLGGVVVEAPHLFVAMSRAGEVLPPSAKFELEIDQSILRKLPEHALNRFLAVDELDRLLNWSDDAAEARVADCRVQVEFITGAAGTGKSYECRGRRNSHPNQVVLSAATGIASINMGDGTKTVNSVLGFYDLKDLQKKVDRGELRRRVCDLAKHGVKELVIDEVSMVSAEKLDLIFRAFNDVGATKLTLVGDFCQLPPIEERDASGKRLPQKYAFDADCWPHFAKATNRLTKMWRQDNPIFLEALNALRRGDGAAALDHLRTLGVQFRPLLDQNFAGTTLIAVNEWSDRYNMRRLRQIAEGGRIILSQSRRWALERPPTEWDKIPDELKFSVGSYVMVLANSAEYVNGDTGHVVDASNEGGVQVRLERTGKVVKIGNILRTDTRHELPKYAQVGAAAHVPNAQSLGSALPENPVYVEDEGYWIVAWIKYLPLRLAWATTVHKSQGLTLDRLQIDLHTDFIGAPAMLYVAVSRCRTPGGLTLVGTPEQFLTRCTVDPRLKEWL